MMKMGGMEGIMGMMPGMKKMQKQINDAGGIDEKIFKRQIALIQSMTKKERANPQIMQASRKKRVAQGAGLSVQELNQLMKMQRQMGDMMKKMGKGGMLKQAMGTMFGKGPGNLGSGMPSSINDIDAKQLEEAAKKMGGGMPNGLPGLGGGLPLGLSGFGKKK
jgi:signal recognition particle subunit SRP54